MADNVHQHHLLRDISEPIMAELLRKTQESVFLGVPAGHNTLCIAALESTRSMRLYARVGILSPLYVGGAPKVLLANMTESKRERHLDYFEDTVSDQSVDWEELRRKLARIRHQGYGITIDGLTWARILFPRRSLKPAVRSSPACPSPDRRFVSMRAI